MSWYHQMVRAQFLLIITFIFLQLKRTQHLVQGARGAEGCYDNYQMSCQQHKVSLEEMEFDLQELEDICYKIEQDVFKGNNVVRENHGLHLRFLNGISSKDPFCPKMQQAYSYCAFCFPEEEEYNLCTEYALEPICIGMPTRQEILDDSFYPQFKTDEDIDTTCAVLGHSLWPSSIPLCERQNDVLHLCPGFCDQSASSSCFNSTNNLPSCEPTEVPFQDGSNSTIDEICEQLRKAALDYLDYQGIFNLTMHQLFLMEIPENDPMCNAYQEAYPHCFWCKGPEALCFDETSPPSCEAPPDNISEVDVGRVCADVGALLDDGYTFDEVVDLSNHPVDLFILANTTECAEAKQAYHQCLWCDEAARDIPFVPWNNMCENNATAPDHYRERIIQLFNLSEPSATTAPTTEECTEIIAWWANRLQLYTVDGVFETIVVMNLCMEEFCQPLKIPEPPKGNMDYLGTSSEAQRKALIWASRASSFLSFLGASFILFDILKDHKARKTVYHQILIGMAVFDIVTAVAWCFSTAPIDPSKNVEGAMGSEATCKAQAFFIQLGFTSVFYNVSLAIYYVLVISYGWKEFQLKKISIYLLAVPPLVGLGLAFGGITSYGMLEYGCHLTPHSKGDPVWQVLVFVVLPLGMSIILITGFLVKVYCSVRQQAMKAKKWNLGTNQAQKMEQAVFWQCLSYMLAFYITWPIMFSVYLFSVDESGPFGLALTVAFVAPLQGFSNSIVYLRTKLKKPSTSQATSICSRLHRRMRRLVRQDHSNGSVEIGNDVSKGNRAIDDGSLTGIDPSAILAEHREKFSQQMASKKCNAVQVGNNAPPGENGMDIVADDDAAAAVSGTVDTSACNVHDGGNCLKSIEEKDESNLHEESEVSIPKGDERDGIELQKCRDASDSCQVTEDTPARSVLHKSISEIDPTAGDEHGTITLAPATCGVSTQEQCEHAVNPESLYPSYTHGERKDWSKYLLHGNPV